MFKSKTAEVTLPHCFREYLEKRVIYTGDIKKETGTGVVDVLKVANNILMIMWE